VRLDTVAGVPRPRSGGGPSAKPRVVVAKTKRTNEDQRSAIGLVGEVAARAWLQRHYPDVRWTSGNAAVVNGDDEASDSLGYDFEVTWRDTTRLYEVKALSDACAERVEFELGPSEVDAAPSRPGQPLPHPVDHVGSGPGGTPRLRPAEPVLGPGA
jgi:hypothetical protein